MLTLPATVYLPWAALLLAACSQHPNPRPAAPQPGYAAVASGRVDVEGGVLLLTSPREGTVTTVAAREGISVRRGDPLVMLDSGEAKLAVQGATAELTQEHAKYHLLKTQLAAAHQRTARFAAAASAGAGDVQAADDALATETELGAQMQITQAAIAVARYKLEGLQKELEVRILRAPLDAQVVRVRAQPGAHVSPQSAPLVTLLPQGATIIRADLSESYVAAVGVGMSATVSTEDDRGASWPAHVLRVGVVEGTVSLEDTPPSRMAARTVECVLGLDAPAALRFGQRVLVRFGAVRTRGKP